MVYKQRWLHPACLSRCNPTERRKCRLGLEDEAGRSVEKWDGAGCCAWRAVQQREHHGGDSGVGRFLIHPG